MYLRMLVGSFTDIHQRYCGLALHWANRFGHCPGYIVGSFQRRHALPAGDDAGLRLPPRLAPIQVICHAIRACFLCSASVLPHNSLTSEKAGGVA